MPRVAYSVGMIRRLRDLVIAVSSSMLPLGRFALASGVILLVACGTNSPTPAGPDANTPDVVEVDADGVDASSTDPNDGVPNRTGACTPLSQQSGTIINSQHGRLDGTLAYVVPRNGPGSCNGDDAHVHLQIRALGAIYDVAVDIGKFSGDTLLHEADMPIPDGAWSEGWHGTDNLSYAQLGVHSPVFTPQDPAALSQKLVGELSNINHISVFGTGYQAQNGCHLIHFVNGYTDGAIVIHPLASNAHVIFLRFASQAF